MMKRSMLWSVTSKRGYRRRGWDGRQGTAQCGCWLLVAVAVVIFIFSFVLSLQATKMYFDLVRHCLWTLACCMAMCGLRQGGAGGL